MVPALAVVRSLGRQGVAVEVASHLEAPLCRRSLYAKQVSIYPDPLRDQHGFLDWIEERLQDPGYQLIIPVTERSLLPIHGARERLGEERIALPPAGGLEIALDKAKTIELARRLGLRVPRGVVPDTIEEAVALADSIGYPVVVKPQASIGTDELARVQVSVAYARDGDELRVRAGHALRLGGVILQELFRGDGVGIELIADRGRVVYAFQHRRLHEVPLSGGGSSLRESVPVRPELLDAARRLMEALQWHGVAMVEFKEDPSTGEFCLMEINGRFWGSLPLAVAAGADFPAMLLELMTRGAIEPRPPARTGVYCRSLRRDLYWAEAVLRRHDPSGLADIPPPSRIFRDMALLASMRHHFDVQSWRDPLPGLQEIGDLARESVQRVTGTLAERLFLQRQRSAWREGGRALGLLSGGSLLFLCYGNINRSAVAEHLAERHLGGRFRLASAGFHPRAGRPADPVMVDVAARHGIDLSQSASSVLSAELVDGADIILAMEPDHVRRAWDLFPASRSKTFLLGHADSGPGTRADAHIADPYGQPPEVYERCFSRIETCILSLARKVERREPRA